ncbi:hypothetical protein XH80_00550 [Bradyrhizobium sp. CCBAU 45384]|nr:hypothetical protein [Bradyrhizobium sp. CCBAU 45384]
MSLDCCFFEEAVHQIITLALITSLAEFATDIMKSRYLSKEQRDNYQLWYSGELGIAETTAWYSGK